jgi:hypothetical protein
MSMPNKISIFRTTESKARYYAAYETMLKRWPVPYGEFYIPTRFGETHVIASGFRDGLALVLFPSAWSGAVQWFRNMEDFSLPFLTKSDMYPALSAS